MNNLQNIPEPVFKELVVKTKNGKQVKRLFRKWGEVRLIKANGEVKVLRKGGYERVHKTTYSKKKKQEEKSNE